MDRYFPEGIVYKTAENMARISSVEGLERAAAEGAILEAAVDFCDREHNLIIDLPCGIKGIIPREEGALGIDDRTTKDVALVTRVNKPVCFKVIAVERSEGTAYLSRKQAQLECMERYVNKLHSGDIISVRVTHLEKFGCFVDLACGIPSLIPINAISVSRIAHPADRFSQGEMIKAVVKDKDGGRVWLTHKELLGTWDENAAMFDPGETVGGIIRSVEDYGVFIELTPNLAGLSELKPGVREGQLASVFIKAIIPEKMKVKLSIVDVADESEEWVRGCLSRRVRYFIEEGRLSRWRYSSEHCDRIIESVF